MLISIKNVFNTGGFTLLSLIILGYRQVIQVKLVYSSAILRDLEHRIS